MLSNLFKSPEFKKFIKGLSTFDKLAESKKSLTSKEVRAMTDLEMLNISQEVGLKMRSWSKNDSFKKEVKAYVLNSYKKRKVSGLPASYDFVRGNEEFISEIFSEIESEGFKEEIYKDTQYSKEVQEAMNKFLKRYKAFEELYRIKRKMKMLPDNRDYSFSLFDQNTDVKNLFSDKEMKKIVSKINEDKDKLFKIIEEETPSPEFFKREREIFFKKGVILSELSRFKKIVYEENYFLSKNTVNATWFGNFKEVSELERAQLNYKEEF